MFECKENGSLWLSGEECQELGFIYDFDPVLVHLLAEGAPYQKMLTREGDESILEFILDVHGYHFTRHFNCLDGSVKITWSRK